MSEAQIVEPQKVDQPPPADAAPPLNPPAPVVEDAEPEVIEIPTGEKLVPLTALENARAKVKDIKAERDALKASADASAAKDARLLELQQQLEQVTPYAQAYQAAVEAQRNQPPPKTEPTQAELAKFERVAKSLDFYKADGSGLDLDRAKAHMDLIREEAQEIARAQVEPWQQQTLATQADTMLQRALITKAPDGAQPDPEVLKAVWARLDPKLTATTQGAAQAWSIALGHSVALGKGPKKAEPIPDPLLVEKAGGKDGGPTFTLTAADKQIARDLGMTEKEYQAEVAKMPQGWGKG